MSRRTSLVAEMSELVKELAELWDVAECAVIEYLETLSRLSGSRQRYVGYELPGQRAVGAVAAWEQEHGEAIDVGAVR